MLAAPDIVEAILMSKEASGLTFKLVTKQLPVPYNKQHGEHRHPGPFRNQTSDAPNGPFTWGHINPLEATHAAFSEPDLQRHG